VSKDSTPSTGSTQERGLKLELIVPIAFRRLATEAHAARVAVSLSGNLRVFQACDLLSERQPASRTDVDPSVLMELRRIDLKLTLMLDVLADLSAESHPPPPAAQIVLDSNGFEWLDAPVDIGVGDRGIVDIFIQPGVPRPLRFLVRVVAGATSSQRSFKFEGLSEAEADGLERLIFRQHRQKIASSHGL
jgi:hypothetical protein